MPWRPESTLEDLVCRIGCGRGFSPIVLDDGEPRRGTIPSPFSALATYGNLISSGGCEATSERPGELKREEEGVGLLADRGRGRPPDRRLAEVDVPFDCSPRDFRSWSPFAYMKLEAGDVFPWGLERGASGGSEGCDDRASDAWKNSGVPDVISEKELGRDIG